MMEDVADLLGAVVGDFHTDMRLICREGLTESFLLTLREPITRGAQKIADLIEGIALAPAVTGRVLLDAAAYLIKGIAGELDDMEGGASPLIIKDLDLYPQPPTNTRSPTLNSEEPENSSLN